MLFQLIVAVVAICFTALLFVGSGEPPPAIVYVFVAGVAVFIAVRLRAIARHGGDVKVSFKAPPEWFGRSEQPTWMGRPVGDQLGSFWTREYWRRRKVSAPPSLEQRRHRGQ